MAGLGAQVKAAQARLAASDAKAAEAARTKQASNQVLGQANTLAGEIQPVPRALPVGRGLEAAGEPDVQDVSAALAEIVPDPGPARPLSDVRRIVIHHTGMAADATPEAILRRTAGQGRRGLPYHYLVDGDGMVSQLAPLDVAVNQSRLAAVDADAIGVTLGGDFDLAVPTEAQMAAAAELLAGLLRDFGLAVNDIYGRSETGRGRHLARPAMDAGRALGRRPEGACGSDGLD